jgi:hypothetical protein
MGALAWVALVAILVLWSLLALAANGLLAWAGNVLLPQADLFTGHPETVAWIGWAIQLASDLGGVLIAAIWGVGVLGLLVGFWLLRRWVARRRNPARPSMGWR